MNTMTRISTRRIPTIKGFEGIQELKYFFNPKDKIVSIGVETDDLKFDTEKFISSVTNKGIPDGYVGKIRIKLAGVATISTAVDCYGRVLQM